MANPFYITTPIFYVNDVPHIGHAYTTVVTDVLAGYHKLFGDETFFLTGTDEHGQKSQNAALARGVTPQAHVDEIAAVVQRTWDEMHIKYDIFMRTTAEFHKKVVQDCLQELFLRDEIYLHEYEGWYCVSEELFYTEKDLVNGKTPSGKDVTKISEKNYFFRMSKYQSRLIEYIEKNPDFIQPAGKRSETLGFLKSPLSDLCISRPKSRLAWGIELPFDKTYVTYVWFDALLNYLSGIGFKQEAAKQAKFERFWPTAVHIIGKDILTTHTVYWPTMLMALGLPLPKTIFAHGWWLTPTGSKMSKSEGFVVAPLQVKDLVGLEPFRYFLVRDIHFGNDASFSTELVINRINSELANGLGNSLSRSTNLVEKYFGGLIPQKTSDHPATLELIAKAEKVAPAVKAAILALEPHNAVGQVVELIYALSKYLDILAPWTSAKTNLPLAGEALYTTLEVLRIAGILLSPVMPEKMAELLRQVGFEGAIKYADAEKFGLLVPQTKISKVPPMFPRIELKKVLEAGYFSTS